MLDVLFWIVILILLHRPLRGFHLITAGEIYDVMILQCVYIICKASIAKCKASSLIWITDFHKLDLDNLRSIFFSKVIFRIQPDI